jgi:hypothetical protein
MTRVSTVRAALLVGVAALVACATPRPTASPWFEETGTRDGLNFVHESGHGEAKVFPEIMVGGVALFDMDGDGDLDAYLVQGGSLLDSPAGESGNRLFENVGQGRFVDVTQDSGTAHTGYGMGVAAGDYDDDGATDLYVTNFGPNVLLRNVGSGRFVDVTERAGVQDPGWGASAAFLDYDSDGDLDLFVTNYINWTPAIEQNCYNGAGLPDYCLPTHYKAPAMDRLFRNEGDGTFSDVSVAVGLQEAFGNGLGVVISDFDGDGRPDIFVANDAMMNQLWMNRGERFVDEALLRGNALDEHGTAKSGMGVMAIDLDDDGDEDLLVGNFQGQTDSLFLNRGGLFSDATGAIGLGAVSRGYTRFGLGIHDFDNDGRLDLYQANGRAVLNLEPEADDPYAESNLLLRGMPDGTFAEVFPRGGTEPPLIATSRAAAFGDVDGDGGIDVVVVNRDSQVHLLRNVVSDRGHWLRVRVLERSGRDALGARVTIDLAGRRLTRFVRAAYSYCASSDPAVHVGLGQAEGVDSIEVTWPGGDTRTFGAQQADQTLVLTR